MDYLALLLRNLGLGLHKEQWGSPEQWAKHKLKWLDNYCFYRSKKSIEGIFSNFFSVKNIDDDYIKNRLNNSRLKIFSRFVSIPIFKEIMIWFIIKLNGIVILTTKLPIQKKQPQF